MSEVICGKRYSRWEKSPLLLLMNSILHGTTIRRIVKMLKDSGANKVHVAIASPEFLQVFMESMFQLRQN